MYLRRLSDTKRSLARLRHARRTSAQISEAGAWRGSQGIVLAVSEARFGLDRERHTPGVRGKWLAAIMGRAKWALFGAREALGNPSESCLLGRRARLAIRRRRIAARCRGRL